MGILSVGGLTNPLLINILHSFLARANEVAQVPQAVRKPCGLGSRSVYCFLGFALKGLVFVSSWFWAALGVLKGSSVVPLLLSCTWASILPACGDGLGLGVLYFGICSLLKPTWQSELLFRSVRRLLFPLWASQRPAGVLTKSQRIF